MRHVVVGKRIRTLFLAATACALFGATAAAAETAIGVVEPIREETLAAVVVGRVAKLHVREGATVRAGELLVELDSEAERLDLERRRLVLASAVELELAKQRETMTETEWKATQRLRESSRSVSQEELNRKEFDYLLAKGEREQLERRKALEALEVKLAEEQLARRFIRAPGAGVVTRLWLRAGEVADARQPLVHVVDVERAVWVANLDAALAARLRPGLAVRLLCEMPAGPVEVEGVVDYLAPVLDAGSGLRRVKVEFANPAGRVTPGVTARLLTQ